ncbi:uncharacterized protein LOC144632641 [Oculina patagonica]
MLLDAVSRGRIYQVKFLLESSTADVNKVDENRQTALMKAIFLPDKMHRTRYKIVKILLEHGARVNIADREGKTALMWACIRGQEKVVRKILDASLLDLDLNGGDRYGNTALFYAASSGQVNTVRMLVTALKRFGLDMDKKNAQGMTPILEATKQGHDSCAEVLMTEGKASLTIRDPETFLNTKEWAERRSLTNLSELIARRTPSPQIAVQNVENEPEQDGQTTTSVSDLSCKNTQNNFVQESSANELKAPPPQQRRGSVDTKIKGTSETPLPTSPQCQDTKLPTETTKAESVSPRSTTSTVSLTRRKSEQMEKIKGSMATLTAKSEMCRLLSLYGIQHSESYRHSFDPILLPPSGYWPDPLAHLRSGASSIADDQDFEMNLLDLIRPRGSGRRKSSAFPGAPEMGRRGSNVNFRDSRRGSTMFNGLGPGMGKRGSISPATMMGNKNLLEAPGFSQRRTTLSANAARGTASTLSPFDRRGSLMPRGSEPTRPTLPRRTTTHLAPSLGFIVEKA